MKTEMHAVTAEQIPLFADLMISMVFIVFSTYVSPQSCAIFIEAWKERCLNNELGNDPRIVQEVANHFTNTLKNIEDYVKEMRE